MNRESFHEPRPEGPVSPVERQLATAQAITHMGSWEWNAKTNIVRWSDELYRIYGLEPQSCEITFDSFLARLHPEDRDRTQGAVAAAFARGTRFAHPERIVRPDGSIRHLDTVGEPALDSAGQVVGLIGTCRDVTDEWERAEQLRLHADIVRNVQIGLAVWSVGDPDDVATILLVAYNPAAERLARRSLQGAVGKTFRDVLPFAPGGQLESLIRDVARDGKVRETSVHGSRDAADPTRSVTLKAFPLPGGCVGIAIEDITAQTLTLQMAAAEQHVFEMIAEGAPLTDILHALAIAIEEQSPPTLVSIHLLDPDGKRVRHGAAPRLPDDFRRAIDGAPIGPSAGSCGTAAFLKRAVLVSDIETDARWNDYRELARRAGLRACWSTPILATDGHVLGTFALYYREPRAPTDRDLALIARATHIAGIAIERRQLEEELRALSAHLESAREEERTGIAREIHDELGQCLTAFKMDLAWIGRRAMGASGLPREALLEKVAGHVRDDRPGHRPGAAYLVGAPPWRTRRPRIAPGARMAGAGVREAHGPDLPGSLQLDRRRAVRAFARRRRSFASPRRRSPTSRAMVTLPRSRSGSSGSTDGSSSKWPTTARESRPRRSPARRRSGSWASANAPGGSAERPR